MKRNSLYLLHLKTVCKKNHYQLRYYAGSCKRYSIFRCFEHNYTFSMHSEIFLNKLFEGLCPCKYCQRNLRNSNYEKELQSYRYNTGYTLLSNYNGYREYSWFRCPRGHCFKKQPRAIRCDLKLGRDIPCPYCKYIQACIKAIKQFHARDFSHHYELLELPPYNFKKQHWDLYLSMSLIMHNIKGCHHIFKMRLADFLKGHSCPLNVMSHGEHYVLWYLVKKCGLKLNYNFYYGYTGLKNTRLHLDFYIPSIHTGIEFDGAQHFYQYKKFGNYKDIHRRDIRKSKYYKMHHILLIRVEEPVYKDHDRKYYIPHIKNNVIKTLNPYKNLLKEGGFVGI